MFLLRDSRYFIQIRVKFGMETVTLFVVLYALLELAEASLQFAPTLGEAIARLYGWYRRSVFLFFAIHPTFYTILFLVLATGKMNLWLLAAVAMKIFDIFYKIEIINAVYLKKQVPPELEAMLAWRLPQWLFFSGVLLYTPLVYMGLSGYR